MSGDVYSIGVQLALADAGLVKEAATWAEAGRGARTLAGDIGKSLKDFFTAGRVRRALKELHEASPLRTPFERAPIPRDVAERVLAHLQQPKGGAEAATSLLSEQLEKTRHAVAKSEIKKALLPYGIVGGLGTLGAGGYAAYKGLYPDAGKWKLL